MTKVWNASRFVQMNLGGYVPGPAKAETAEDAWMLSRLARIVAESTEELEAYDFGEYARNMDLLEDVCGDDEVRRHMIHPHNFERSIEMYLARII